MQQSWPWWHPAAAWWVRHAPATSLGLRCTSECHCALLLQGVTKRRRDVQVVKYVDALEARVVTSVSPAAIHARVQHLDTQLQGIEAQLAPGNVKGLRHAVDALAAAVASRVCICGIAATRGAHASDGWRCNFNTLLNVLLVSVPQCNMCAHCRTVDSCGRVRALRSDRLVASCTHA